MGKWAGDCETDRIRGTGDMRVESRFTGDDFAGQSFDSCDGFWRGTGEDDKAVSLTGVDTGVKSIATSSLPRSPTGLEGSCITCRAGDDDHPGTADAAGVVEGSCSDASARIDGVQRSRGSCEMPSSPNNTAS